MTDLYRAYTEMVQRLAKPGQEIVNTLSPQDAHLLHMAVGISGEAAELLTAVLNSDRENVIEELGDLRFYGSGLTAMLPLHMHAPLVVEELPQLAALEGVDPQVLAAISLVIHAGEVLDLVKRAAVYRKVYDLDNLAYHMSGIGQAIRDLSVIFEIGSHEPYVHNMNKLEMGERARYADGTYSDAAAQARADKQGDAA